MRPAQEGRLEGSRGAPAEVPARRLRAGAQGLHRRRTGMHALPHAETAGALLLPKVLLLSTGGRRFVSPCSRRGGGLHRIRMLKRKGHLLRRGARKGGRNEQEHIPETLQAGIRTDSKLVAQGTHVPRDHSRSGGSSPHCQGLGIRLRILVSRVLLALLQGQLRVQARGPALQGKAEGGDRF